MLQNFEMFFFFLQYNTAPDKKATDTLINRTLLFINNRWLQNWSKSYNIATHYPSDYNVAGQTSKIIRESKAFDCEGPRKLSTTNV